MGETIRVGVLGARGRMGSEICRTVTAAPDLELVVEVDLGDSLSALVDADTQVVVDFTHPGAAPDNVRFAIDHGIAAVVGTSGFDAARSTRSAAGSPSAPGTCSWPPTSASAPCWPCSSPARPRGSSSRSR